MLNVFLGKQPSPVYELTQPRQLEVLTAREEVSEPMPSMHWWTYLTSELIDFSNPSIRLRLDSSRH